MAPFLQFLFPRIPKEHPAYEYIALNTMANILGLGWAATPAGLKAMEELAKLEEVRRSKGALQEAAAPGSASNEMCIFLILNISSLQLIPVNMIAYRSQYGSVDPTVIIAPAIVATLCSTLMGIVYCKIKDRSGKRPRLHS
jgi:spore maturation protein A